MKTQEIKIRNTSLKKRKKTAQRTKSLKNANKTLEPSVEDDELLVYVGYSNSLWPRCSYEFNNLI